MGQPAAAQLAGGYLPAPVWKECQPIYYVHKHPPAGLQLAWVRGRSHEGGYMAWTGEGFIHPPGQCPETHTT